MLNVANCTRLLALAVAPIILVSCGGSERKFENPNMKPTIPVHGEVYLDGKPGKGVKVVLNPKESAGASSPSGEVGEDGTFQISTYALNDGAPVGEYLLTFTYKDPNAPLMISFDTPEEPDDFKGKYADPKTSKHPLSIKESDEDKDVGRIDLKRR